MGTDRNRYHPRVSTDLDVDVLVSPGEPTVRRIHNLSIGGMQVSEHQVALEPGQHVWVGFSLPQGGGQVRCYADVIYSRQGNVGLRFRGMAEQQREGLAHYLEARNELDWFGPLGGSERVIHN